VIVPTDTQKQTTYIVAKQNPVNPPEVFAAILAQHFIDRYAHIHVAHVDVIQHRWTRMEIDGKPHPHSFFRDGAETRVVTATATEGKGIEIRSGVKGLLVLKSTGSAFYGYDTKDKYTILPETNDRILSTEVECGWKWKQFANLEEVKKLGEKFNPAWESTRNITMETFAKEESPSVQNTMYKMCEQILEAQMEVDEVDYTLPNKHYFQIGMPNVSIVIDLYKLILSLDLSWFEGLENTGENAEVYAPQSDPNGLIRCVVTR
jgi:urate oxidase